jgi:hypothetical protein
MKNFPTVMYQAWVFRNLNFDTGLNYVQKTAHSDFFTKKENIFYCIFFDFNVKSSSVLKKTF